jgi:hypothetical protein
MAELNELYKIFEDRFNELDDQKRKYGDKWTSTELSIHLQKQHEVGLLYRRFIDTFGNKLDSV